MICSELMLLEVDLLEVFKNLDMEMDDLVIEESLQIQTTNMICSKSEELEVKDVLSNLRSLRKGLSDVTNSPRLPHAESPKSRKSFFAKPLMPRAASMYNRCSNLFSEFYHYHNDKKDFADDASTILISPRSRPSPRAPKYHLETLTTNDSQAFRRIDARTLCQLMKSMSSEEFAKKYVLIDCRYPYEFNGGHIKGAINIYDTAKCEEVFFPSNSQHRDEIHRRIPIFYCEYSQKRGPSMAQMLRSVDRQRNVDAYPKVDFPEIYVVDKGYRNFFEIFRDSSDRHLCEPCSYVAMADIRFTHHLKRFNFHKKSWGNTTCSRSLPPQSRLALRQLSEGAYYSPSNPAPSRPSSRRPLFAAAPKTPEPPPQPAPLRPLHFS
ncbi:rhodanese-like protein [Ancylostoma duodenale]|uniref:M-phase inducer phosphatase n=1 Tax=Ancylostoma duodenale TaxID=51022 RepID=A0A0C2CXN5_9BILA|nr:rhodanese-like protein [Ancylostoma duodenale]